MSSSAPLLSYICLLTTYTFPSHTSTYVGVPVFSDVQTRPGQRVGGGATVHTLADTFTFSSNITSYYKASMNSSSTFNCSSNIINNNKLNISCVVEKLQTQTEACINVFSLLDTPPVEASQCFKIIKGTSSSLYPYISTFLPLLFYIYIYIFICIADCLLEVSSSFSARGHPGVLPSKSLSATTTVQTMASSFALSAQQDADFVLNCSAAPSSVNDTFSCVLDKLGASSEMHVTRTFKHDIPAVVEHYSITIAQGWLTLCNSLFLFCHVHACIAFS